MEAISNEKQLGHQTGVRLKCYLAARTIPEKGMKLMYKNQTMRMIMNGVKPGNTVFFQDD